MGVSAAIAVASLVGGAVAQKSLAPDIPQMNAPPAPPAQKPAAVTKSATGAAEQQKKRAAGAIGRSDTILTGPQGLGELGGENQQVKSLLGY